MKEIDRCIIFLEQNGWKRDIDNPTDSYDSFFKNNYVAIDFNENEMIFISEQGDFLHVPINYYTLIGVLMEYRQIDCNYKGV